ncbi:unnamed protein product [Dracunculus medinensis]|uniref:ZP domain-containing protein n=1 Tax=Dracunculus medinensis TaxID=318479 RepID=A0A0N4UHX5_DRAME|nr:unnamed protein product [Dracunculus medinensis]
MLIDQSAEREANVRNLKYGRYFQKGISSVWAADASMLTGHECGPNMVFTTVDYSHQVLKGSNSSEPNVIQVCIQQCQCANPDFTEKNGICVKNTIATVSLTKTPISYQKSYKKQEHGEIVDFLCRLPGHKCGPDMKYVTVQFDRNEPRFSFLKVLPKRVCIIRCEHINPKSMKESEDTTTVSAKKVLSSIQSVIGKTIHDAKCRLTGRECGPNMVFATVDHFHQVLKGSSSSEPNVIQICIQRCQCANSDFTEKDGSCLKNITNTTVSPTKAPISYQKSYKKQEHGGEIVDFKCRLPGHKCGANMKYITVQFDRKELRHFLQPVRGKTCIVRCVFIKAQIV